MDSMEHSEVRELLGELPIRRQPGRRRVDRVDVPVVQIAEGRL